MVSLSQNAQSSIDEGKVRSTRHHANEFRNKHRRAGQKRSLASGSSGKDACARGLFKECDC
jgi:hypothetical protein